MDIKKSLLNEKNLTKHNITNPAGRHWKEVGILESQALEFKFKLDLSDGSTNRSNLLYKYVCDSKQWWASYKNDFPEAKIVKLMKNNTMDSIVQDKIFEKETESGKIKTIKELHRVLYELFGDLSYYKVLRKRIKHFQLTKYEKSYHALSRLKRLVQDYHYHLKMCELNAMDEQLLLYNESKVFSKMMSLFTPQFRLKLQNGDFDGIKVTGLKTLDKALRASEKGRGKRGYFGNKSNLSQNNNSSQTSSTRSSNRD